jgi:hypothetical protein
MPAEGHAAVFVRLSAASMSFVGEVGFDDGGWVADDVVLGDTTDTRHFTLYLYAVTDEYLAGLTPEKPVAVLPMRLLDVLTVVRDNGPDTC